MKILSGNLKGRPFEQPKTSSVRPLSEKVRAAIFDVIGAPTGLSVLDVYAGSGAAGFEALSRGALMVEAIEANARVAKTINANAAALGLDMTHILHQMSVTTWLVSPHQAEHKPRYDVIIADPPYAQLEPDILEKLAKFLLPEGVLVLSHSGKLPAPMLESVHLVQSKMYGDTSLTFYQV